jgi:signal transduction histidine kinase
MERINRIKQASENCKEIAHTVQALSHELHSSNLDFLGLVPALRDFCREFSDQHRLEVKFTTADVPHPLPQEISLCVLRVVQEGLRNAVKHSGANCFQVSLRGTGDGIELHVGDEGAGFTPETAQAKGGLGLVSMRERVQLAKGTIRIDAKPGRGTKITVNIPVSREIHARSA